MLNTGYKPVPEGKFSNLIDRLTKVKEGVKAIQDVQFIEISHLNAVLDDIENTGEAWDIECVEKIKRRLGL